MTRTEAADKLREGAEWIAARWNREGRWSVEPISLAEGRLLARFSSTSGQSWIGKWIGDRDQAALVHSRMRALASSGSRWLRVPEPIAFERTSGLLLMEEVRGHRLDRAPSDRGFELAGAALGDLHALTLDWGPPKPLRDHARDLLRPAPDRLLAAYPHFAQSIRETLEVVRETECTEVTPLHRDFQLRQLLDDGVGLCVLDWDDASSGDPLFDVVYFLVYLENHLEEADAKRAGELFLAGYSSRRRIDASPARQRPYRLFNLLRRSLRRFRLRDAGWEPELFRMLERLEQAKV